MATTLGIGLVRDIYEMKLRASVEADGAVNIRMMHREHFVHRKSWLLCKRIAGVSFGFWLDERKSILINEHRAAELLAAEIEHRMPNQA